MEVQVQHVEGKGGGSEGGLGQDREENEHSMNNDNHEDGGVMVILGVSGCCQC